MPDRAVLRPDNERYACDLCGSPDTCSGFGQACDICKRAITESVLDRTVLGSSARDAGRVPPQAKPPLDTTIRGNTGYFMGPEITFRTDCDTATRYTPESPCPKCNGLHAMGQKHPATHATKPLVSPERRQDIQSFRNALDRICEAYGVKIKGDTDASGDILIFDLKQKLPSGYDWSAYIEPGGKLEFAEYVLEDESGATKQ